jgi:hypothetical protein
MPNPINDAVLIGTAMIMSRRRYSGSKIPPFLFARNFALQSDRKPARGAKIKAASMCGILVRPICEGSSLYGAAVSSCRETSTSAIFMCQYKYIRGYSEETAIPISQRKKELF